jgi:plastocyanin
MKTAFSIIAILFVVSGVYFYMSHQASPAPTETPDQATMPAPVTVENSAPAADTTQPVTVTYNGTSFSPSSVSVHVGDRVTFTNTASAPMWVASDPHPAHSGYSGTTKDQHCPDTAGTAFDQCTVGATYTFTFAKAGTWGYHNHTNHTAIGTVVVTK